MVRTINNCPFTIEDIHNANGIYGRDVPTLKSKIVREQPKRIQAEYIEWPDSLRESIGKLTIADYFMFVNITPFVVSVSRWVVFITVEYVSQR